MGELFALLHVASHGLVDVARPEAHAVLGADTADDGLLTLEEIARLRVDRAAVVLSACHTSGGAVRRGEGTLSLGRAFFEGGARAVVANLATVRDDESAALFGEFYRRLESGEPLGTALAEAKRARIRGGAPPASWSTYVLLGDAESTPVQVPPGWRSWTVRLSSLALVLLAVWLWRRWRSPAAHRAS
jgi:CHAT domain-containing protein